MMEKLFRYTILLVIFLSASIYGYAQQNQVEGIVKDQKGETLPGIYVINVSNAKGTFTDSDGKFSLAAKEGEKISFTFLGFKAYTLVVDSKSFYNIVLEEDSQELEAAVVVGYGTMKKKHLTGALEVVNSKQLTEQAVTRLDEAIIGQTAGVFGEMTSGDPTSLGEYKIRVRGTKGDNGAPLLVIDGVPRFGTLVGDGEMRLSDINTNDVESITILKDAAAAAVYGARAANGVILVTTKRGKTNRKLSVNYSGRANFQQATQMPNFVNAYDFANLYNTAIENTPGAKQEPFTAEQLEDIKNGSQPDLYSTIPLEDYLSTWGWATSHHISASGGSDKISYYVSGNYSTTTGLYSGVKNDRFGYNVRLDAELVKGLQLSIDINGNNNNNKNPSYLTISSLYSYNPLQPLTWSDGSWVSIGGSNPLESIHGLGGYNLTKSSYNTTTAQLSYDLTPVTKGLKIYAKGSFDNNILETRDFDTPTKLYLRQVDVVDGREQVSYVVDNSTIYPTAKSSIRQTMNNANNTLIEAGLNYNRTFNDKHSVSGMLVTNYQENKWTLLTVENTAMQSPYPEFAGNMGDIGRGIDYKSQRASLVGRLNYSFEDRYVIEGSFRYDGSTKFHPDNRWGFFPTASFAWNVINEEFFKSMNADFISNLRVRASTGILGNDGAIDNFSYLNRYMLGNQSYQIGTVLEDAGLMVQTGQVPNPVLEWGKSTDYNIGVDLGLFDGRFNANFEYYWRYRTNDIRQTPAYLFPPSIGTGTARPYQNFGKTKTWGYDLSLGWNDNIGRDFSYNIDLMMSQSYDIVLDAGDESDLSESQRLAGKPVNSTWMYKSDGLFASQEEIDNYPVDLDGRDNATIIPGDIKYLDLNGDGELGKEDEYAVEYLSIPDFAANLRLGVRYKGFFVNALFQGMFDYLVDVSDSYTLESSSLPRFQDYHLTDSWTPDNLDAEYPVIKFASSSDNNRETSDFWYRNTSYVRLKTLSAGYTFSSNIARKLHINSLSLAFQAGNVFTICSLKGIDPEVGRGYPVQRTYGLSLNIGF